MKSLKVVFKSNGVKLAGVLRYPENQKGQVPAVHLIHGSLEQDRDGNLLRHPDGRKVPRKNFFLEISKHLCSIGCATFSWDKRGYGESEGSKGNLLTSLKDTKAALNTLFSLDNVVDPEKIAILGQSAGVYIACLLAKEESGVCAYIFQGGLYRDYSQLIKFNYLPVKRYAERSREHLAWLERHNLWGLVMAYNLQELEKAGKEGKKEIVLTYKGKEWRLKPESLPYRDGYAPSQLFKYIKKPVLILHGEYDLNVPVEDAYLIEKELKKWGNRDVELKIISKADHSFQEVAEEEEIRLKEMMSLACFSRPYREEYFKVLTDFVKRILF